jgi:hypothetical protein
VSRNKEEEEEFIKVGLSLVEKLVNNEKEDIYMVYYMVYYMAS